MTSCGTPFLDTSLNPGQQILIHSGVAIFFEHAAKKLFSYLSHHPTETFTNALFSRVLKSTILDHPRSPDLQILLESACQDTIVLEEIEIDNEIKGKVLECANLVTWIRDTFPFEINVLQWTLTRGLLLASNPYMTQQQLQEKFEKIYSNCETCGAPPEDECDCTEVTPLPDTPPPDYHDNVACPSDNDRCESCKNIESVGSRYHSSVMKLTAIGTILDKSIQKLEHSDFDDKDG